MVIRTLLIVLFILVPRVAVADTDRVEIETIQALWNSGARDSALALTTLEVERAREGTDKQLLARFLLQEGIYRTSFGDNIHSEPLLSEAKVLAEALPDSTIFIGSLRWLGVSISYQGRIEEAHEIYQRVLELAEILQDRRHEGWARIGLAWVAWTRGDGDRALIDYRRAAERFAGTADVEGELWALNGMAMVQTNLGEYEIAMASYRASLDRARAAKQPMAEAIALNDLGHLEFATGLPDRALEHFRASAAIHIELGNQWHAIVPHFNIAACLNNLGRFTEARQTLATALATCVEQGYADKEITTLVKLGDTLLVQGRTNEAIEHYRRVLDADRETRLTDKVNAHIGLSEALIRQDRLGEAMSELERARELLVNSTRTWQQLRVLGKLGALHGKLGRHRQALDLASSLADLAERHKVVEFQVQALAHAARSCLALSLPDSALTLFEEAADTWESERRLLLDPDWRERRGSNGKTIFTDLASLMIERGEKAAAFDRIQSFKGRTLAERMLGPGQRHDRFLTIATETATLEQLRETVLAEDELLLDFYLGPSRSLLFAVSREKLEVRQLPPAADLDGRLRAYFELLASPGVAGSDVIAEVGGRLARTLFGEDLAILGDRKRIIASLDGALNLIPFTQLPGCGERLWTRTPSASILLSLRDAQADVSEREPWRTLALASGIGTEGERLSGTLREVKDLERRYRRVTPIRLDRHANSFGAADLAGFDILHLAAHARRNDQNPWQSSIQFLPGKEGGELRASEITELRLDASLAVLSSCGSGGGGILSGEGVLGLSSAFLVAGVPTVLATLWAVDDAATSYFVKYFYRALADGETCAKALMSAQVELRSHPETRHPYYWAGFVLIGEGELRPNLRHRPTLVLPAAGIAVLLIVIVASRRRRRAAA